MVRRRAGWFPHPRRRLPLVLLYWGGMEKMKQIIYGVTDVALCEAI